MLTDRRGALGAIAQRIIAVRSNHPTRVAIDGIDAAGKTTLADELAPLFGEQGRPVIRASIDGFHNPQAVRYARGRLSPEGYYHDSYNLPVLIESLLAPLGPDGDGRYRGAVFDYRVDAPVDVELEQASARSVLLFDGIFLGRPELAAYWDLFIFVQISFDTCLARGWERNKDACVSEEEVRRRYQTRYLPAQRYYLSSYRPIDRADIIIDNNDPARPVVSY